MRTVRALLAGAAVAAVLGLSSTAMAAPFQVQVFVGWDNSTGTCNDATTTCLGFDGTGGFTGTSTTLNWDEKVSGTLPNSFLSIGALPQFNQPNPPFEGAATNGLIDVGQTIQTAQIQHINNILPDSEEFLATITVKTELVLLSPDGLTVLLDLPLDVPVTFVETPNTNPPACCDDVFTFIDISGDFPFSFGGINYNLHVEGLVDAGGNSTCEAGAVPGTVNCFTSEAQTNNRFVIATLEQLSTPVPLPGTLLLLGVGMLGMGAAPLLRKRG
jgi:hypothetical protein